MCRSRNCLSTNYICGKMVQKKPYAYFRISCSYIVCASPTVGSMLMFQECQPPGLLGPHSRNPYLHLKTNL